MHETCLYDTSMECLLCKGKGQNTIPLCLPCQRELPWHKADNIAFKYKPPIDRWISLLKFHHQLQYAHLLGQLWVYKLRNRQALPGIILPIPLHRRRLCQRGFNQALEIAKPISRHFKIPIDRRSLKRTRHTKPQSELTEKERFDNVADAFHWTQKTNIDHIILFDDVMTTGNTLNAAYNTLKKYGVRHIELWSCAKT